MPRHLRCVLKSLILSASVEASLPLQPPPVLLLWLWFSGVTPTLVSEKSRSWGEMGCDLGTIMGKWMGTDNADLWGALGSGVLVGRTTQWRRHQLRLVLRRKTGVCTPALFHHRAGSRGWERTDPSVRAHGLQANSPNAAPSPLDLGPAGPAREGRGEVSTACVRSSTFQSIPVAGWGGEASVGCESGLNFNHPKGPEKLMVGGEGWGELQSMRDRHKQPYLELHQRKGLE